MLGPGFEPGSPALRAGAITTKPPWRSLKLLIYDLSEGYSKAKISSKLALLESINILKCKIKMDKISTQNSEFSQKHSYWQLY